MLLYHHAGHAPLMPHTSLRHPVHCSQLSGASLSLAMPKQVVMKTVTGMAASRRALEARHV